MRTLLILPVTILSLLLTPTVAAIIAYGITEVVRWVNN